VKKRKEKVVCPRFFSLVFFFFDFHFFPSRTTFLSLARGETLPPPSIGIPAALLFERKKKKKKMSLELDCSLSLVFFLPEAASRRFPVFFSC
jgi:hypothetical protein